MSIYIEWIEKRYSIIGGFLDNRNTLISVTLPTTKTNTHTHKHRNTHPYVFLMYHTVRFKSGTLGGKGDLALYCVAQIQKFVTNPIIPVECFNVKITNSWTRQVDILFPIFLVKAFSVN